MATQFALFRRRLAHHGSSLRASMHGSSLRASMHVRARQYSSGEPFATGTNAMYAEAMYDQWQEDPSSVHSSWRAYFETGQYTSPPGTNASSPAVSVGGGPSSSQDIKDHLNVSKIVQSLQARGHSVADLDPLGTFHADLDEGVPDVITPQHYGFSEKDLSRKFLAPESPLFQTSDGKQEKLTLQEIIDRLKNVYCGKIGYEYTFLQDEEQSNWFANRVESTKTEISKELQLRMLDGIIQGTGFENFLQKKHPAEKRFGLDGCEVLVPGMQHMLHRSAVDYGIDNCVFGMAHRGRLNFLSNVMGKPLDAIFSEFQSLMAAHEEGSGDVKYHLGLSNDLDIEGKKLHVSLLANPSHLEAVNPLVLGKARCEQDQPSGSPETVLPVLIHGDAAFAGQGVVYETMGMADLPSYRVGGTMHVVINNQIGFTTDPRFGRSTGYCTEIAKMVDAPILHVNADDPDAVMRCFDIALDFRQKFGKDVVVDLVCYRRYGHNEADQPMFTQPKMYNRINKHPNILQLYSKKLVAAGVITQEEVDAKVNEYQTTAEIKYRDADKYEPKQEDFLASYWSGFKKKVNFAAVQNTGIDVETLREVGKKAASYPEDFNVHKQLQKVLKARQQMLDTGKGLDWASGEALAFGTLLAEGNVVRLSGQDVERGTFSHRHHVLHDQKNYGERYIPLQHLKEDQAPYYVSNSHLSEFGVLGFELGYSVTKPDQLVLWEGQFGDFANTAQCIIDQFISSGEQKWGRQIGLTLLLPHGYEGMGPEHSSCRLERFLQLCDEREDRKPEFLDHEARRQIELANMQVVVPSTPANYFHLLRRQIHRDFRKPLIVVTPKSLLRHKLAVSDLDDMGDGTRFKRLIPEVEESILPDSDAVNENVERLVYCSGKVYYDLIEARANLDDVKDKVAIARVEQVSPFPFDLVARQARNFPNAEIVWCQEEPRNMGAWAYTDPRIETCLEGERDQPRPRYIGRPESAATATGDKNKHKEEQQAIIDEVFTL